MKRIRGLPRLPVILTLTGLAACASSPETGDPCALPTPSTAGWTPFDEGDFTLLLPPAYARVEVQGIDSRVGRWEAPGRSVSYDLGAYANPLVPNDLDAFPGLVVCQEGDGRGTPRIVRYSPAEGGYAVGAHWPDLRQVAPGMSASLTVQGVAQSAEDLGEILAILRSVRIEVADSPPAGSAEAPAAGSPDRSGYRAGGNEPFWALRFGEGTMDFSSLGGEDTVRAARPRPERLEDGWRFTATADGQPFVVRIQERRCGDSMSGRPFPHTVTVTAGGQSYTGCGGDTESLLTGEEWRVERIEDDATTGRQRPTLRFEPGGALTGTGGCNRFRSTYEITGEGIEIGPALATRMACVDPAANEQEVRFFALLEQVTRFDIAEDGGLRLFAGDRPVLVARRSAASPAPLTEEGWGPIRIGMTRAEVVAAAGEDANPGAVGGPEPEACDQFRPERAPEGMLVMVERGRVTRITLSAGTGVTTERGFGVGDPAAAVREAYGAEAVITPHKYSAAPAEYITVWKTAPDDPEARGLVYEIGPDGRVAHVHAGGSSIQYVEGCL